MIAAVVNEQQVIDALHRLPVRRWPEVLDFIAGLAQITSEPLDIDALAQTTWTAAALQQLPPPAQDAVLRAQAERLVLHAESQPKWWTAWETARLPFEQRGIILEASATVAAKEYEENSELTAFDAFGKDDLDVDSSDTRAR